MMPWEKYASAATAPAPEAGPWTKYAGAPVETPAEPAKAPEPSLLDKAKGVGEAGLALASGIPATLAGQVYGVGKTLTGGEYGTQAGAAEGEAAGVDLANKLTYQPKTATGKDYLERMGQTFDDSKLAGLPVEGSVLSQIPKVPKAAGAAARTVSEAPAAVGRAAVNALPAVDAETAQLARDAHAMGFRLRPDQVYGNRVGNIAGELSSQVPLSGSARDANQAVFNRNVVKAIGGEGDKLTRQVFNQAMEKAGSTIGAVAERTPLPIDYNFLQKLEAHATDAKQYESPEIANAVEGYMRTIRDQSKSKAPPSVAGAAGGVPSEVRVLPGPAFRTLNTKLNNQIRSSQNGDLRRVLGDFQDDLHDERAKFLSPEDAKLYDEARRQYAAGKTLEPLVAKSATGDIKPSALLGAVTANRAGKAAAARGNAGDLGKLADIGQRFLKEPGSSGTAERNRLMALPAGAAGGGAVLAGLPAAAGTAAAGYGAANLYNRLGPRLTQRLIDRPPVSPPSTP